MVLLFFSHYSYANSELDEFIDSHQKHYEKIAEVVKRYHPTHDWDIYVDFVHDLCVIFEEDKVEPDTPDFTLSEEELPF